MKFPALAVILPGVSAFQLKPPIRRNVHTFARAVQHTKLFYYVNIAENTPRDVQTMDEWSASCGVLRSEGFQLTSEDGTDISVMTTVDLPANSPVLFVPSEMILSSNGAVEELGRSETIENLILSVNAFDQFRYFYLMMKILVEYERGEESPWYPWLNSLPRYFSNGASMTPLCFECLPPLVSSLAVKERVNLLNLNGIIKKVPFLSDETRNNADLCKWAFQIAYTRSFEANDGSGDLRIVPMADMFNHGTETEISISYDDQGNCNVETTRDVPAGSPLRMSYGDPTNPSYLLARYGFLDESSPGTFCKIMIPHVNSQLEDMGYAHNRMLFFKETGDVSQEVWDVLLYQILSSSNAAKRRKFYEAQIEGYDDVKMAMHQQHYPETAAKLLAHIDGFLGELEDLSAKAYGKDINEHPRIPLILKHNEFVRNTFLRVRERYF